MSKSANPTAIGGFVLGAVLLSIAGVITFSKSEYFEAQTTFVAYFESSVAGLDVGAPIQIKGVQVGTVTSIRGVIDPETLEIQVPVHLTLNRYALESTRELGPSEEDSETIMLDSVNVLIGRGLRAKLKSQSFVTGKLFVDFAFEPDSEPRYRDFSGMPEIPTVQGDFELLTKNLEDLDFNQLIASATHALQSIDQLVSDPEVLALVSNVNALVKELYSQALPLSSSSIELLQEMNALVKDLQAQVTPISGATRDVLEELRGLIAVADEELAGVSTQARELLGSIDTDRGQLVAELDGLMARFKTIEGDYALMQNSASLIQELRDTVRTIRSFADFLERHPEALLKGKD